jgi:transposase
MATEAMLAHVATMKYGYQVPLYRQEQMLASQGINLDRATLALWMGRLAWWLKPLHDVLLDTRQAHHKVRLVTAIYRAALRIAGVGDA